MSRGGKNVNSQPRVSPNSGNFSKFRHPEAIFFPGKKVGLQPQNILRLAFPESVRAVVGSICRNSQVLGFGQNECKVKGVGKSHNPDFLPDPENMKMPENTGICIFGIRPASGGVNLPKWTSSCLWSKPFSVT